MSFHTDKNGIVLTELAESMNGRSIHRTVIGLFFFSFETKQEILIFVIL